MNAATDNEQEHSRSETIKEEELAQSLVSLASPKSVPASPPTGSSSGSIHSSRLPSIQNLIHPQRPSLKPNSISHMLNLPRINSPGPHQARPSNHHLQPRSITHHYRQKSDHGQYYSHLPPISPKSKQAQQIMQAKRFATTSPSYSSMVTSQSTQSPVSHTAVKYDIRKDGTPIARRCGDCDATHTSGHWCQDPLVVGGYICQKCYRRRKRSASSSKPYTIMSRNCYHCSTSTTKVWFKHPSLASTYVCYDCHHKVEDDNLKGKKCYGCGSSKSTKWAMDPKGNMICRKCTKQLVNANTIDKAYLDPVPAGQAVSPNYTGSPASDTRTI